MKTTAKQYTIGIDIGGTKMLGVLYDGQSVIDTSSLATPRDNLDHFLVMVKAVAEPLLEKAKKEKYRVANIGLSIAGTLNLERTLVLRSPNLPIIDNKPVGELAAKMLGLPVAMDHDVNCFVRGEVLRGGAGKFKNVYGVIVGTGIGGAWWLNGDVYRGAHGGAGEPGAMVIDFPSKGLLEPAYHQLAQNNPAQLAEEAYRGDILALKAYEEIGETLGMAFANIVNILDPEAIVVGGGATRSGDLFLGAAKKAMLEYIESPESRKKVKLIKSKLGDNAGAIGAALLVAF